MQSVDAHRRPSESSQKREIFKSSSQNSIKQCPTSQSPTKSRSNSLAEINPRTAYLLLDQVRHSTQLSYEMSKVAVTVVLSGLQEILPSSITHYFDAILSQLQVPLNLTKLNIEETYDANRLKIIFTELTSCKEDSQQRSWMLYEDEPTICEYIKELTSILVLCYKITFRHFNPTSKISKFKLQYKLLKKIIIWFLSSWLLIFTYLCYYFLTTINQHYIYIHVSDKR